jgi:hypothetical protein
MGRRWTDAYTHTCTPAEQDAIAWAVRIHYARCSRRARAIARGELPFPGVAAWLREIDRQDELMRPSSPMYERFDAFARTLTIPFIRAEQDLAATHALDERLRQARHPWNDRASLHGLSRVWSRAELGVLITEATNRARQLAAGDPQRPKGPPLDPRRLPDDRLDHLIQRHRDLAVVEALRRERARRAQVQGLAA